MTPQTLIKLGVRADRANAFAPSLVIAMLEFDIGTKLRRAGFLSQVLHETQMLRYVREVWGATPAQSRYEGRKDLGNTQPGDGFRYRGRGFLQITGRDNYARVGLALGVDLIRFPESLESPLLAARSAGWYWKTNNLNKWADAGDIDGMSDVINRGRKTERFGDANGFPDRLALYVKALEVLA